MFLENTTILKQNQYRSLLWLNIQLNVFDLQLMVFLLRSRTQWHFSRGISTIRGIWLKKGILEKHQRLVVNSTLCNRRRGAIWFGVYSDVVMAWKQHLRKGNRIWFYRWQRKRNKKANRNAQTCVHLAPVSQEQLWSLCTLVNHKMQHEVIGSRLVPPSMSYHQKYCTTGSSVNSYNPVYNELGT